MSEVKINTKDVHAYVSVNEMDEVSIAENGGVKIFSIKKDDSHHCDYHPAEYDSDYTPDGHSLNEINEIIRDLRKEGLYV